MVQPDYGRHDEHGHEKDVFGCPALYYYDEVHRYL